MKVLWKSNYEKNIEWSKFIAAQKQLQAQLVKVSE